MAKSKLQLETPGLLFCFGEEMKQILLIDPGSRPVCLFVPQENTIYIIIHALYSFSLVIISLCSLTGNGRLK